MAYSKDQLEQIRGPGGGFGRQSLLKAQGLGWDLGDVQSSIGSIGEVPNLGKSALPSF